MVILGSCCTRELWHLAAYSYFAGKSRLMAVGFLPLLDISQVGCALMTLPSIWKATLASLTLIPTKQRSSHITVVNVLQVSREGVIELSRKAPVHLYISMTLRVTFLTTCSFCIAVLLGWPGTPIPRSSTTEVEDQAAGPSSHRKPYTKYSQKKSKSGNGHRITESYRLEKTFKIIESNRKPNTTKTTTTPCL
ncbi:hypothetical protein QYF61_009937 [Mycteria americana]|uniref:Uncharacterized protein n=1 Tax=Mycteria americana TaxID=33587 RepID=A0AAN7NQ45_MYCAM|nr:hypothetical protein QYF61_009937 [Mycteria americana]